MRVKKSFKIITNHYKKLLEMTDNHLFVGITNEWILDNYYLIIEQKPNILGFLKDTKSLKYINKNVDLYSIIEKILEENNYRINEAIILKELTKYQKENDIVFLYQELCLVPILISIILIDKISDVCLSESNKLKEKKEIDFLIDRMIEDLAIRRNVTLNSYLNINEKTTSSYIVYFNEQLREMGENSPAIFKELNEALTENGLALRDIIYNEHVENAKAGILINNAFYTVKKVGLIKADKIYESVSQVELALMKDPEYSKMDDTSKNEYRNAVIERSKKKKMSNIDYINMILEKEGHIGEYLFKPMKAKARAIWYLFGIAFFTLGISFLLSKYLFEYRLIAFLVLLIPISEIVIVLLNKMIQDTVPSKPLLKMDFSKGIPKDQKTMVVIPTIIKNGQKVNEVLDSLEMYYLSNKSKNIYFALLGDCSEEKTETIGTEDSIVEAGHRKVDELNKKYGKKIFYFVYRRRFFNPGEGTWLGHERKRGALTHFNDLILGNLSEKDQNKLFVGHSFKDFKENIKYVITLDVDTKLVLNSAKTLVAAMAHPLNKPVLNDEGTQVISGYGIMQPKIAVDIDSTNKSLFTQIYAGVGGFDPYNTITPNFYQDAFNEGSFVGKGIYDLEVFQKVLKYRFPDNLILSHDLIEGAHIRCANITDVELIDDFPSKYLIDASRRSRWARGDMQIFTWMFGNVRDYHNNKVKNKISLISRFKIFDNLRRGMLDFFLALMLILAFISSVTHPGWWILLAIFTTSMPSLFYIFGRLKLRRKNGITVKYYNVLTYGGKAILLRGASVFTSIPFNAYLYVNSFVRALHRMFVSKKHLLNWITAEDAEKTVKSNLGNVVKQFWLNYVYGLLIIIIALLTQRNIYVSIGVALLFYIAPLLAYLMSKDMMRINIDINNKSEHYLYDIAKRTWNFFGERLTEENNYLIPDNYQLNRSIKDDYKTSPTNIGFSLTSVVAAAELKIIDPSEAMFLLEKIVDSIEKLDKWNGHLYNWYDVKTMEVLAPNFVSSVDSANLVASMIIAKEYVARYGNNEDLKKCLEKLIKKTDFSELYSDDDVFSIGFNDDEERLEPYCYNKFASESRIISFVAIAKGDVPSHHWFQLDKTLTAHNNRKGLLSWSGTAFEYFMPLLYMYTHPNTLIDESYHFCHDVQKEYMKKINRKLPWGISESAYNELDDAQNYKYRAFGIPYLRLKEEPVSRIVISPYSSILAITKFPKDVLNNLKKFKNLGLEGEYGFYESYDVDDKATVYAYYAHHQGMILGALANYLHENVLQHLFMGDINNRTFEILNKEKVQIKPVINIKSMRYKKYTYEKEPFANDMRIFKHISSVPEISVLSNAKYSVLINDRGNGFSRYRTIQLNRYRKITEQDYGMFLYIRDLESNKTWSNTYAPMNIKPDKYEVVFNLDRIKFVRSDYGIMTTTEVVVAKMDHAEIRKITFRNSSKKDRKLELTSYMEPIICDNNDDIAHRVYNNLFIKTEYDHETNSIIMRRKSKTSPSTYYLINRLLIDGADSEYQFETDRVKFIGRGNSATNPAGLQKDLSGYLGASLDPIISLRNQITIERGKEKTIYMIVGFGKSKEQVMNIVQTFKNKNVINERAFEVATIMANVSSKMVNITAGDMRIYNTMLNYLYQTSKISINEERIELLRKNVLGQKNLWKFGVSGDRPIILVDVKSIEDISIVKEVLHAFEYYKSKSIFIDLVFLNAEDPDYAEIIAKQIEDEKYHMYAINSFHKIPGSIYVVEREEVTEEEYVLLSMTARLKIDAGKYLTLYQYIEELQKLNTISDLEQYQLKDSIPIPYKEKEMDFFNGYGGFVNDGKEYLIVDKNTPTVWSNVIANQKFGTIVTNNNCGFTYSENSREYKLTSWTNDTLLNDLSEAVRINDANINYDLVKHGFGYSEFKAEVDDLDISYTTFVAKEKSIKFYKYTVKNTDVGERKFKFTFFINPTLGVSEDKTGRHILCDYHDDYNLITLKNVYHEGFKHLTTFVASTEELTNYSIDKVLFKEIENEITLKPGEEKEFAFMLGTYTDNNIEKYLKYQNIRTVNKELAQVKDHWQEKLGKIQVKTPDKSFNHMLNGWLLYQSLSSRLFAKAGYYQVGGAFGFRDQLQDSMNICLIEPEITRKQILINASHQFEAGDVLHWWHVYNRFGLRSRYKDDYLWMVYATSEYIRTTGDYSILDEQVPYVVGKELESYEMERGMEFTYTEHTDSLYTHLEKALHKSMSELGENGIPLMGGGDWNDGMNEIGKKGKGTSVWLGFFLYFMINKFMEFTKVHLPKADLKKYQTFNEKMVESLQTNTWDGEYFLRAFFDSGNKVGSKDNEECSIDLISQSFSILTDIATPEQRKTILEAVENKLVDKENKIVKLLTPAFQNNPENPGYIMNYPEGIRENGGQYTHAVSWYVMALIESGLNDKAFEIYQMVNPINHALNKEDVLKYQTEPYVVAADIYSNKDYPGRGGWTWYTGSSAWFYRVGIVDILGFHKEADKLYINPNVPTKWKEFTIDYQYQDTKYKIKVIRSKTKKDLVIDKKKTTKKYIPLVNDKIIHNVEVYIEDKND